MQTIKHILILIGAVLFIQCGNSTNNDSMASGKCDSTKDACWAKDTVNKDKEIAMQSEIICPKCGYKKVETMPTDVCVIKYTCEKCNTELRAKEGDCCVFCTYGTHKCPSMQ